MTFEKPAGHSGWKARVGLVSVGNLAKQVARVCVLGLDVVCDKYRRGTGSSSEAACHMLTWGPMVRVRGSTDGNCQASPTGYLLLSRPSCGPAESGLLGKS